MILKNGVDTITSIIFSFFQNVEKISEKNAQLFQHRRTEKMASIPEDCIGRNTNTNYNCAYHYEFYAQSLYYNNDQFFTSFINITYYVFVVNIKNVEYTF